MQGFFAQKIYKRVSWHHPWKGKVERQYKKKGETIPDKLTQEIGSPAASLTQFRLTRLQKAIDRSSGLVQFEEGAVRQDSMQRIVLPTRIVSIVWLDYVQGIDCKLRHLLRIVLLNLCCKLLSFFLILG